MDVSNLNSGSRVRSTRFGLGTVELDKGTTAIIRFEHGLEECDKIDLQALTSTLSALTRQSWDAPLEVINRLQAEAIQSVNDLWGVFSRSRIELLPHQLWVCRLVNEAWPARWLVADDVGLGKTIEAGMILLPLLARGTVRRLLIVCPAHLVEQWQYRMRTIFDIRLARYAPESDTRKSDFWGTHPYVVASLQTLRLDRGARHERMLEADPWDLVMVDEAHHLNADEDQGPTLGYRLLKKLIDNQRVESIMFFTGTPHRGKDYGFLALLNLLRPDLFDLQKPFHRQLANLSQVMIRNNKASVTDLKGRQLFREPRVRSETYAFSPEEERFYRLLSMFIVDGQAYASGLESSRGRAVMLVLIAMQKLASSSTAAIRHAIRKRLARVETGRQDLHALVQRYEEAERTDSTDELAELEEQVVDLSSALQLMENEVPRLRELLEAADQVSVETKIEKLMRVLEEQFTDRSVLFFTEYKATQGLLLSSLMRRFGRDCAAFINGDNGLEDVTFPDGSLDNIRLPRELASSQFNKGLVRFMISTEAGGEGIDLQENCHTLVHVDLPWNPMRLHQRVGRLNRYGQKHTVDVLSLRNPDTVESLIWEKLNEKLGRISLAFNEVMDEPEDLLQLVLGMTNPSMFRDLFSGAAKVPRRSLNEWFEGQTARFGGGDVVQTVQELVGNTAKFDFKDVSDRIPKVDLPDLRPFLEVALTLNGRRPKVDEGGFSFRTPDKWRTEHGISPDYRGMRFDRSDQSTDAAKKLLGVGHKVISQALKQARERDALIASLPVDDLEVPLIVFRVRDRVTGAKKATATVVVGVQALGDGSGFCLIKDWELLQKLNGMPLRKTAMRDVSSNVSDADHVQQQIGQALAFLEENIHSLEHPFQHPVAEVSGALWPI